MAGLDYSQLSAATADLQLVPIEVETQVPGVVREAGKGTVSVARAIVAFETGTLKNSIGVDYDADGMGFVAGPTAPYGEYVEDGDYNNAPQPYMRPAFDGRLDEAEDDLGDIAHRAFQ